MSSKKKPTTIKVNGYEARVKGSEVTVYAVTDHGDIEMPSYVHSLCDNDHLEIRLIRLERPTLFDLPENMTETYVPFRTGDLP